MLNNLINNKSKIYFFIPLLIIFSFYLSHLFFFAPFWPMNADTLFKLYFVNNSETFNIYNHQHLRWGSYFLYAIVNFFLEINYLYIVIISFIFFIISVIIFTYIVHTNFGLLYSLIFLLFFITSKSLSFEIFSYSVVNQTLLPLSIFFGFVSYLKNKDLDLKIAFILSILMFWIYGIKETNIFFFAFLIFFDIFRNNLKFVLKIILILLIFYIIETVIINYLYEGKIIYLGKLQALLFGGLHIQTMQNYNWSQVSNNLERFFVIFYRWYSAREWDTSIFYISLLVCIFITTHKDNKLFEGNYLVSLNSNLFISFFVISTFFVVSLFPIILGQPLNTRFLTILLPFSFISILFFIKLIIDNTFSKFISLLLIFLFLTTFFSKPIYSLYKENENWGYLSLSSHYKNSIWERQNQFNEFNKNLNNFDCIIIESINPHVESILDYLQIFVKSKNIHRYFVKDNYFKNQNSNKCIKKIIIHENKITYL